MTLTKSMMNLKTAGRVLGLGRGFCLWAGLGVLFLAFQLTPMIAHGTQGGGSVKEAGTSPSILEEAFKQEIALLEAEKAILTERLLTLQEEQEARNARLTEQVNVLTEKVTARRLQNDALEEELGREEEVVQVGSDRRAHLENVLDQAVGTLRKNNVVLTMDMGAGEGSKAEGSGVEEHPGFQSQSNGELVMELFGEGVALAERLGRIRVDGDGKYFDGSGNQHSSPILWFSQVGAIGLDGSNGGALGPAGANSLAIVSTDGAAQAKQFLGESSGGVTMLGVNLFDPTAPVDDTFKADRTLKEIFLAGGIVMWPILMVALLALVILIERLFVLGTANSKTRTVLANIMDLAEAGRWDEALAVSTKAKCMAARVARVVIKHRNMERQQLEDVVNETLLKYKPRLERGMSILNAVAVVSPLLGLLGTVTGMIGTFTVITEHGTGDPRLLSGGISEALLTTEFGLMVAIPVLLVHTALSGKVDRVFVSMEVAILRLLNQVNRAGKGGRFECPILTPASGTGQQRVGKASSAGGAAVREPGVLESREKSRVPA